MMSKTTIKTGLTFFKKELGDLNIQRTQVNRSKGLANYLAKPLPKIGSLSALDTPLGLASFIVYQLRFAANMGLLLQGPKNRQEKKELYYALFNDALWSTVNLLQFVVLSFKHSNTLGMQGLQLEALAQGIDLLVLLIRFQQDKQDYEIKFQQANEAERRQMSIERRFYELNFLRTLATSVSIMSVFALFAFAVVPVPISLGVSIVLVVNTLTKLILDLEKDKKMLALIREQDVDPLQLIHEQQARTKARLYDVRQALAYNVYLPVGLFLFVVTPAPVAFAVCLVLLLIHLGSGELIERNFAEEPGVLVGLGG